MKLKEISGLLGEKKEQYSVDPEAAGLYSHTKDGRRYYEIEEAIGYNAALDTLGEKELALDVEATASIIYNETLNTKTQALRYAQIIAVALPQLLKVRGPETEGS